MTFAASEPLDIDALRRSRRGERIGGDIRYFEELASTSTTASELAAAGAAEGVVVIAESQSRGRGRLGRSWLSPPYRNLYVSLVLRPPIAPTQAPILALVAGLATADALAATGVEPRIKWPNDVLVDGRKVAGILAEMAGDGASVSAVVLGIGINVNLGLDELPEDLRDKAGSVAAALGAPVARHDLAARLLAAFQQRYDRFVASGFSALRDEWNRLSCLNGERVDIVDGGRHVVGTVSGVATDGALELVCDDGRRERIVAGEVTVAGGYERG